MGRNTQLSIEDDNGVQVAIYKVAYGSRLFLKMVTKLRQTLRFANGILTQLQSSQKKVVLLVMLT